MNNNNSRNLTDKITKFDFEYPYKEGFAVVELNQKWGFIDENRELKCEIKYEHPYRYTPYKMDPLFFSEGLLPVGRPNEDGFVRFGYLNTEGKEACKFKFTAVTNFRNGLAIVRDENYKWLVINRKFEKITKRTYDRIHDFFYGYAVVELNGLYGFINENGEEVCEIKYPYMSCFGPQGFAQIELPNMEAGRAYWIDTRGKEFYMEYNSDEMCALE